MVIPRTRDRGESASGILTHLWLLPGAIAVLAGAGWLRALMMPSLRALALPYLVTCAIATAAVLAAAGIARRGRRSALACGATLVVLCVIAALTERALRQVETRWDAYLEASTHGALTALDREVRRATAQLQDAAARALDAPADPDGAFRRVGTLVGGSGERGLVLYDSGGAVAWAGRIRTSVDRLYRSIGAEDSPFYITLYATAVRGERRAVATALLHAEPPGDRLATALDALVARATKVSGFEYAMSDIEAGDARAIVIGADTLFYVRPAPSTQGEVALRMREQASVRCALLLGFAVLFLLIGGWRVGARAGARLVTLVAALGVIAVVPLNASFSNATRLFNPSLYYARFGGPFTASVGALSITSALVLLALLSAMRSPPRLRSRWLALLAVVAIAALGPFLLRDLARGINAPPRGVPTGLWISWEVALFLAAAAILLGGISVGRAALGARRGVSPVLAPACAGLAAFLAPLLWETPGGWPGWYPAFWIAAIALLAIARRSRGFVLNAAIVAACGAVTLVWGATARKRVQLAERDVAGLNVVDPDAVGLVTRLAIDLVTRPAPTSRAALLSAYVRSDLSAAGFPAELASWRAERGVLAPSAVLVLSQFEQSSGSMAQLVEAARDSGRSLVRQERSDAGVQVLLAVPHADGQVTTVAVAPRTRLIPDDPFTALIGLAPHETTEPPYTLTLAADVGGAAQRTENRWQRKDSELHGDWIILGANGPMRVHVEVDLRSSLALVQRGALLVLLDVFIIAVLWTLAAASGGGLRRWVRVRIRGWTRSYRARLTLALFAFFVIPAVIFAAWSYRRLLSEDQQSRELVVREALRSVGRALRFERPEEQAQRVGIPLFVYDRGVLRGTSDGLYDVLAPVGRFLRPDVTLSVALDDEVDANRRERVGGVPTLFGYRAAIGETGDRLVLATPARSDEVALDRQRRDLGILVLFATAMGALAALGLSGLAARELARPIGSLQQGALAIAAGEREPELGSEPPTEFRPVFLAFRQMAADLAASRSALEEAQRRTEAVLRNVASGVIATDAAGCVTLANPRAEALLGRAVAPGTPLGAIGEGGLRLAARLSAFLVGADDEEEFDLELRARQLHGRLTRLTRGGGGAVLTLDDVTELARAQRVLAWGEMARQVAHEIKNPLTPIRLGVQHLRRARRDGRVDFDRVLDQNVERILAEIDRLDEIARAFSRYGTAPSERAPGEPVDIAAIVRDVVDLERLGESGVRWSAIGADDPAPAIARGSELREVLLNVLENARLANARAVCVRVERRGTETAIVVEDDGDGIPAAVLPRIFEPHFSTRTSGSGLGLAITRGLVEGWGGGISVESVPRNGTTVTVTLATAPAP